MRKKAAMAWIAFILVCAMSARLLPVASPDQMATWRGGRALISLPGSDRRCLRARSSGFMAGFYAGLPSMDSSPFRALFSCW